MAEVVGKEVTRLLAQLLDDSDEVLDVETALFGFQARQLCGRNPGLPRDIRLRAPFGFAQLPEHLAIHDGSIMDHRYLFVNMLKNIADLTIRKFGVEWSNHYQILNFTLRTDCLLPRT